MDVLMVGWRCRVTMPLASAAPGDAVPADEVSERAGSSKQKVTGTMEVSSMGGMDKSEHGQAGNNDTGKESLASGWPLRQPTAHGLGKALPMTCSSWAYAPE